MPILPYVHKYNVDKDDREPAISTVPESKIVCIQHRPGVSTYASPSFITRQQASATRARDPIGCDCACQSASQGLIRPHLCAAMQSRSCRQRNCACNRNQLLKFHNSGILTSLLGCWAYPFTLTAAKLQIHMSHVPQPLINDQGVLRSFQCSHPPESAVCVLGCGNAWQAPNHRLAGTGHRIAATSPGIDAPSQQATLFRTLASSPRPLISTYVRLENSCWKQLQPIAAPVHELEL